mgnify:CR=1 FL=1
MLKDLRLGPSNKPKYIQVADCFIENISRGNLRIDEKIPSIDEFSKAYNVSRDTVEKGYKVLKNKQIIKVIVGKGTYVNSTKLIRKINVLFLINKLSAYKLEMYNSFRESIGNDYHTDFEIYNCDESIFFSLIEKHANRYDYYIIMPHFKNTSSSRNNFNKESLEVINNIPREKLVIMDNNELKIGGDIIEIFQDFENDIFGALSEGIHKIRKYNRINLVISEEDNYTYLKKIKKGLKKFCALHSISYKVINKIKDNTSLQKGDLFIVLEDDDLVKLIDFAEAKNFKLGHDVGLLSYNETPLKRLLKVAVLSTEFSRMGSTAAEMILSKEKGRFKNPFRFIDRDSI